MKRIDPAVKIETPIISSLDKKDVRSSFPKRIENLVNIQVCLYAMMLVL